MTFVWYNFCGSKDKPIASYNLAFEEAAVLMNVALLHAQLGTAEGRGSADRLRRACHCFLSAAGALQHVIDEYCGKLVLPPGADLTEPVLSAVKETMLAQAQECFVLKGLADGSVRDAMLAKLANSAAAMYETAAAMTSREKNVLGPGWAAQCLAKSSLLKAQAAYRKACEMLAAQKYGAEIVRLEQGTAAIKEARAAHEALLRTKTGPAAELAADIAALGSAIAKALERALRDNDIIYHDPLPSKDALGDIGTAVVANPIAFKPPKEQPEIVGTPLFSSLPAFCMQQSLLDFYRRRDDIVLELRSGLKAQAARLEETLARMNLPAALEATESDPNASGIPAELRSQSESVRAEGGAESLRSARATVQMLREDCLARLRAIDALLSEEESEDGDGRASHGTAWRRQPSSTLNKSLKERTENFRKTLGVAANSDAVVQRRLDEAMPGIERLSLGPEELETTLPSAGAVSTSSPSELRACLEDGRILQAQIEEALAAVDAASRSLQSDFLAEPVLSDDQKAEMADEELTTGFQACRRTLDSLSGTMDAHLLTLQSAFASFSDRTPAQTALLERASYLHDLAQAHQAFLALAANLQEGVRFYNKCADSLSDLEGEARDYRESRRFEMQDLLRAIEDDQRRKEQEAQQQQQQQALRQAQQQQAQHPPTMAQYQSPYTPYYPPPGQPYQYAGAAPYAPPPSQQQPSVPAQPQMWTPGMPVQYASAPSYPPPSGPYYPGQPTSGAASAVPSNPHGVPQYPPPASSAPYNPYEPHQNYRPPY